VSVSTAITMIIVSQRMMSLNTQFVVTIFIRYQMVWKDSLEVSWWWIWRLRWLSTWCHIYWQSRGTSIFRVEKCRFHGLMSQNTITLTFSKGLFHCANVVCSVVHCLKYIWYVWHFNGWPSCSCIQVTCCHYVYMVPESAVQILLYGHTSE
jgi:hypothetical protein